MEQLPRTAIWPRMPWTKIRWLNCWGVPSPTASLWGRRQGARYSPKAPTLGTLQTLPACDEPFDDPVGKVAGSSLHAGVAARADERNKLERLCRYIARPAVSEKRLSLTPNGNVRYQLKTPYRKSLPRERSECFGHGTTHVIFEPLDFIPRLAVLVPRPRVNLTRFHGVFAPNSKHRAQVTPARRGKGNPGKVSDEPQTPAERRASMTWAQRLKRVFHIDIETCRECGGAMKVVACIEDPVVMPKALRGAGPPEDPRSPEGQSRNNSAHPAAREPPVGLFG